MKASNWVSRGGVGGIAVAIALACAPARAATVGCSAFRAAFLKATSDMNSEFVRPLTVTRRGAERDDIYDLVSKASADAVLTCRGESLIRFEANIAVPGGPAALAGFARIQKAAMMAAFKWTEAHAESAMRTINSEAKEYLQASIQRGDVALAGKTEYHEGGGDLGMMYTPHRRTFVVVGDQ